MGKKLRKSDPVAFATLSATAVPVRANKEVKHVSQRTESRFAKLY